MIGEIPENVEELFTVTVSNLPTGSDVQDVFTDEGIKPTSDTEETVITFEPKPETTVQGIKEVTLTTTDVEKVTVKVTLPNDTVVTFEKVLPPSDEPQDVSIKTDGIPAKKIEIIVEPDESTPAQPSIEDVKVEACLETIGVTSTSGTTTSTTTKGEPSTTGTTKVSTVSIPTVTSSPASRLTTTVIQSTTTVTETSTSTTTEANTCTDIEGMDNPVMIPSGSLSIPNSEENPELLRPQNGGLTMDDDSITVEIALPQTTTLGSITFMSPESNNILKFSVELQSPGEDFDLYEVSGKQFFPADGPLVFRKDVEAKNIRVTISRENPDDEMLISLQLHACFVTPSTSIETTTSKVTTTAAPSPTTTTSVTTTGVIIASVNTPEVPLCNVSLMSGETAVTDDLITYSSKAPSSGLGRPGELPWYPEEGQEEGSYIEITVPDGEMAYFYTITLRGGVDNNANPGFVTSFRVDVRDEGVFKTVIPTIEGNSDSVEDMLRPLGMAHGDSIRIYPLTYSGRPIITFEIKVCIGFIPTTLTPSTRGGVTTVTTTEIETRTPSVTVGTTGTTKGVSTKVTTVKPTEETTTRSVETTTGTTTQKPTEGTTVGKTSVPPTTPPPTVSTTQELCVEPMREKDMIPDSNVDFSSTSTAPVDAKIDGTPWTPAADDTNPYVTVTFDGPTIVKRIDVQPGGPNNGYVPEFRIQFKSSPDGPWEETDDPLTGNPKIYDGPQSSTDRVLVERENKEDIVYAIKLIPLPAANVPIELRFELIGCQILSTTATTTTTSITTPVTSECTETDGMSSPAIIPDGDISVDVPGADTTKLRPTSPTPLVASSLPTVTVDLPESVEIGKIDINPNDLPDSNIDTFSVYIKDTGDPSFTLLTVNGKTSFPADEPLILPNDITAESIQIVINDKLVPSDDIKLQIDIRLCYHVSTSVISTTPRATTTVTTPITNICTDTEVMDESNVIPPGAITTNTGGNPEDARPSGPGITSDTNTAQITVDLPENTELGSVTFPKPETDNIKSLTVEIQKPGETTFTPYEDGEVFSSEIPLVFPQGILANKIRIIPFRDDNTIPMVINVAVTACVEVSTSTTPAVTTTRPEVSTSTTPAVTTTRPASPPTSATRPPISTHTETVSVSSPSTPVPPTLSTTRKVTTTGSTISVTTSLPTTTTPCVKKIVDYSSIASVQVTPGEGAKDSLKGSGSQFIGDSPGGSVSLVYKLQDKDNDVQVFEVKVTTKNVDKVTINVYNADGNIVNTVNQTIANPSQLTETTATFNGDSGVTIEIIADASDNAYPEISNVEMKVCWEPIVTTPGTTSTTMLTTVAPTTPCEDTMLDNLTPQMFNITATSSASGPPSDALTPPGMTFAPSDDNPRFTATLDTPEDVPITKVNVTLDNIVSAVIVIKDKDNNIVEQFPVTPTTEGTPETFSITPTKPGTTIQINLTPTSGNEAPVVSDLSVEACIHIPTTTPYPSTVTTTVVTTPKACDGQMINIKDSPNAASFPNPSSGTTPSDVLNNNGWSPLPEDTTPSLTVELNDQDKKAQVNELTVEVTNVTEITAVLKDKDGNVVKTITANPVDGVITVDFEGSEGITIELQTTPESGKQPKLKNLDIVACIEAVSTITTISVTMTTTGTTTTVAPCLLTREAFQEQFGYLPSTNTFGYVEKDGKPGLTSNDEEVIIGDTIGEGVVVIVQCSNCTCTENGIQCNKGPCEECVYTEWSDWTDCSKDCGNGQRERTRTLASSTIGSICNEDLVEREDCNTQNCITTPFCKPWTEWTSCNAAPCNQGSKTRTKICANSADQTETDICYGNCTTPTTTPQCTPPLVWLDCSNTSAIPTCPLTCKDFRMGGDCVESENCQPACYCPIGKVTDDLGNCIDKEECGCYNDNGEPVVEGDTWIPDGEICKECKCEYRQTTCTEKQDCCQWSSWGPWGQCSVSCETGTKTRYRTLEVGNSTLCGNDKETESCTNEPNEACLHCVYNGKGYNTGEPIPEMGSQCQTCYCTNTLGTIHCMNDTTLIIDGNWSQWGNWSECSSSCTGGMKRRTRTCNDPLPSCGGNTCPGNNEEVLPCNEGITCCDMNSWMEWTDCSKECDGGIQFRIRTYVNSSDSVICNENQKENRTCNTNPCGCPEWGDWGACTVSCGTGTRTRARTPMTNCESTETEDCTNTCECPDRQKWSDGTECRRTCANRFEVLSAEVCQVQGCVCENGYFFDDNDTCVNNTECEKCIINGQEYQPGDIFEKPDDRCYRCECVDGNEECTRICQIPTCKENEELSYVDVPDPCCPVCKPIPHTCTLITKTDYISDGDCKSNEPVTFTYCAGSCGNSTHTPTMTIVGNDVVPDNQDCKCCTGEFGSIKKFDVTCTNGSTGEARINILKSCSCNECIDTKSPTGKRRR